MEENLFPYRGWAEGFPNILNLSNCNLWCVPISRYNKNFYYKEILNFQIDSRVIRDTEEK